MHHTLRQSSTNHLSVVISGGSSSGTARIIRGVILCLLLHTIHINMALGNISASPIDISPSVATGYANHSISGCSDCELATAANKSTNATKLWECNCYNVSYEQDELDCNCHGKTLVRVPQKLVPINMKRFTISDASVPVLKSTGLKVYSRTLEDFLLIDLSEFWMIEAGAFEGLPHLRTIYISRAPKLQYIGGEAFRGISNTFKSLRIRYCGLLQVPDMTLLAPSIILHMVDLEGNRIEVIGRNAVSVRTEQLILDNNQLQYINESAFAGSEIAILSLKGNRNLKQVHPLAFTAIVNIIELDLSSTSLTSLPTEGLKSLEILRIADTHSLKTIPSVYSFESLQEAHLTHSFHCCAFKFPQRHDPEGHAQQLRYLAELQSECMKSGYITKGGGQTIADGGAQSIRKRKKRHQNDNSNDQTIQGFKKGFQQIKHPTSDKSTEHFEPFSGVSLESDNEGIDPITGAPLLVDISSKSTEHSHLDPDIMLDFGEFHEKAEITPHNTQHAMCGNITLQRKIDVKCYPMPDALNPCEDVMGSDWLRASVWLVILLAIFGNVAVLLVLFSIWSDMTVSRFLMMHLAFADLCTGLYLLLIASIDIHSMGEYFNYAFDWQYGIGCKIAGILTVFASHLSVFTLTVITFERWLAITHALYLNQRLKLRTAALIMVFGWAYSLAMSLMPIFGMSNYSSTSICLPMEARDKYDVAYLILVIAIIGVSFVTIAICYVQMYFSLGKETRNASGQSTSGELTIAKKMSLLVFTNFVCWAPIAFFSVTALAGYPLIDVAKSKILLVFFYPLNTCADPYLYALLTKQYRRDLYALLSKYGICRKRAHKYKMSMSAPTNVTFPVPLLNQTSVTNSEPFNSKCPSNESQNIIEEDFV